MKRIMVPGTTVGLLSEPSKMPCHSWSLPAGESCPWAVTGKGTVCGSCYAKRGNYKYHHVSNANKARFDWTLSMLRDGKAEEWADYMLAAIEDAPTKYFRIHDSGDFFSVAYVNAWYSVCSRSTKRFWAPTRSYRGTKAMLDALIRLNSLPNVTIRPSAIMIDENAPIIDGLAAGGAVVHTTRKDHSHVTDVAGSHCPARNQGNSCDSCRFCWDSADTAVVYGLH